MSDRSIKCNHILQVLAISGNFDSQGVNMDIYLSDKK